MDGGIERDERGDRLLKRCLAPGQRDEYAQHRYFHVTGGESGKRYRIRHGRSRNVDEFDGNGKRAFELCFYPRGNLPIEDVMLAQKMALELFESHALTIARRVTTDARELARLYDEYYRMFHNP